MGTINVDGLQSFMKELTSLGGKADRLCRYSLYGGAKVIADAMEAGIGDIPESEFHHVALSALSNKMPPSTEKLDGAAQNIIAAMHSSLGISKMKSSGSKEEAVIGFAGYITLDDNQIAVAELARSIESGSSVRQKTPFARPAVNRAKAQAKQTMQERAEEYIKNFNL